MEYQKYITFFKKSDSFYRRFCQGFVDEWGLSPSAYHVIMFLANNPQYNTARDICRIRDVKTGITSVAVDQLIRMGYLVRETDPNDRRVQRLYVTEKATDLVHRGREVQREFVDLVTGTLSEEEQKIFFQLSDRIMQHMDELE